MKWVLIVMAVGASGQPEWRYRTLRHRGEAVMRTLMFALTLAFFLLLSLLMIRRLHDCGRSGWWFIPYGLLPFVLYATTRK